MDKRYQVFVSSTYADLKEERQKVIQTLMEMDCIPSGMELFPAADEEQWEFIKRVIDDCDYYLLIVGGRYGSTTPEGISYTEKEYDYAIEQGIKVIALLHANPDEIPLGKSEPDPELRGRLKAFREKVSKNRLVKFWNAADELPGLVALSLSKTMKMYPAVGWVRADKALTEDLLKELNELRKTNEKLRISLDDYRKETVVELSDLASLDDNFVVHGKYFNVFNKRTNWKVDTTWRDIFASISPVLLKNPNEEYVETILKNALFEKYNAEGSTVTLNDQIFQTIKVQLLAYNLINVKYAPTTKGGMGHFWQLTPSGEALMYQLRAIRSKEDD